MSAKIELVYNELKINIFPFRIMCTDYLYYTYTQGLYFDDPFNTFC